MLCFQSLRVSPLYVAAEEVEEVYHFAPSCFYKAQKWVVWEKNMGAFYGAFFCFVLLYGSFLLIY